MTSAGTAFKIGEKVVTWTWELRHASQIVVTRASYYPYNWSADIQSNGSLKASCQLGDFYISEVEKQVPGPIPDGGITTGYPMRYYLNFQIIGNTDNPIDYKLPVGTHVNEVCGTLTVTAVCDVMHNLVDDGVHGWAVNADTGDASGPLYDTPNNSHTQIYLQLNENATYSLVTNVDTYTGELLLTDGTVLDNRLWSRGLVTAKSTAVQASGSITMSNSLGAYISQDGATPSWSDSGATASGVVGSGVVSATCTGAGSFEIVANVGCTYNMERVAWLPVWIGTQNGAGLDVDIRIPRYDDDTGDAMVSTSSGYYSETISQHSDIWSWTATHNGNSAPAPNAGGWNNWGDVGVSVDQTWAEGEQQELPAAWADTGSPYLNLPDTTVPLHTFWSGDYIDIAQDAAYGLRMGYNSGQYTLASNILTATGNASTGSQVGTWAVSAGATVELDTTNDRIVVKPATDVVCTATRTLLLHANQCGSSPTKPARDAWTGYRWLQIILEPADPATGDEIISVGDVIYVEVDQDDLSSLTAVYPDPDTQTWTGSTNTTKRYSAVTQRTGDTTYIDVDLANPLTPMLAFAGENPPVTGNYGDDTTARPNILSHYPQPTMDAPNGGVTNAKAVRLTLPGDTWWRIGDVTLHHKSGATPVFSLMPAYNQWVRMERKDQSTTEDETEAKTWGRRLMASRCEGLLGVELFDIGRATSLDVESGIHSFTFTPRDVATTLSQLTNVQQLGSSGAIRTYPGWAYTITLPNGTTYPIDRAIADHIMGVGCHMGGRGVTWNGEAPLVWSGKELGTFQPVVQGLANAVDWFGGCGDIFELDGGATTGALLLRCGTVLRGAVEGLGRYGDVYDLTEDTRPTVTTSTIVNNSAAGTYSDVWMVGGLPKLDHHVRKDGATTGPDFDDAHTITWTVPTSDTTTATVTECPSWWEHRGVYWIQYAQRAGVNRPRFRASDGKPLCQKRGLGRTSEGRCVVCPHGA